MKRLVVVLLVLSGVISFVITAMAEEIFLIKVDIKSQEEINTLAASDIKVYAKTSKFFLAEVNNENMDRLSKEGISFQIVDNKPISGLYYLVWAKANENIEPYLSQIQAKAEILIWEDNWALIKGYKFKIEQLPAMGFSIKKIFHKPLPVDVQKGVPSHLQSIQSIYDPVIDSMISRVTMEQSIGWVDRLSGEDTVDIGGEDYLLATRYSYAEGCQKAAQYIKERFDSLGLSTEYQYFNLPLFMGFVNDLITTSDGQKGWAACFPGMLKTTDSGSYWDYTEEIKDHLLWEIVAPHEDTLFVVGNNGVILKSTDGGDNWSGLTSGTTEDLMGVYFESPTSGWAVGTNGTVLHTSSGGASWNVQTTPTNMYLYSIDFGDADHGWIVGSEGTILHTTDRGINWNTQSSGTSSCLFGVDFVSSSKGWAVGQSGRILRTTNGGTNWLIWSSGTNALLASLCFLDTLHGWVVGGPDAVVLYTRDGGENWEFRDNPQPQFLYAVHFLDTLTGWVGGYNVIDFTTDGGQTWISQYENVESAELKNVAATLPGVEGFPGEYLITAHYDAVSEDPMNLAPGADDNASGVSAVLTAASILKDYHFRYRVKFVTFAGEEQGLWGSHFYAQEAYDQGDTILGVLNFDMLAYDGNSDGIVEVHCGFLPENQALADVLTATISDYGLNLTPEKITTGAASNSDHASFWDYNFPAILGIEDLEDFNPYYHSTQDNIAAFDTSYFVEYCKASLAGLATLASPFFLGDANGDKYVNISDIVFLIDYVLKSGTPPDPVISGDVNCDEEVNISDVVYLINYVLKSGPPPCSET
jgi:photosystem II stability/assembly factor-like uncharacterized protein